MTGAEGLQDTLSAHLAAHLPAKLAELVARLGPDVELPTPTLEGPQEAMLIPWDRYPIIMVVVTDTTGMVDQGNVDGGREWLVRYRVRLYPFARGEGYDAAARAARRYTLAVRELLLARGPLEGPDGPVAAVVEPRSLRESYSEVQAIDSGRSVAAAYVEAEVGVVEVLPA